MYSKNNIIKNVFKKRVLELNKTFSYTYNYILKQPISLD